MKEYRIRYRYPEKLSTNYAQDSSTTVNYFYDTSNATHPDQQKVIHAPPVALPSFQTPLGAGLGPAPPSGKPRAEKIRKKVIYLLCTNPLHEAP
jgi:hypothetical protein